MSRDYFIPEHTESDLLSTRKRESRVYDSGRVYPLTEEIVWLMNSSFESFATLTLENQRMSVETISGKLRKWASSIKKIEGVPLGFIGVVGVSPRKHVHLLLKGSRLSNGKGLEHLSYKTLRGCWGGDDIDVCVFKNINEYRCYAGYFVHNMKSFGAELVKPYNKRLLEPENTHYAVIVGRNPGAYEDRGLALVQINGFKNSEMKGFPSYEEAQAHFYKRQEEIYR